MHARHDDCPVLGWYVLVPHVLQVDKLPAASWNVPALQLRHVGDAVVEQTPLRYAPGRHSAVHAKQAVDAVLGWYVATPHVLQLDCAPPMSWYEPAAHGTHAGDAVVLHSPRSDDPAPHHSVHARHAACPELGWYVFVPHTVHADWAV